MDGKHKGRRYQAGDSLELEIALHHRANLKEVRAIFEHTRDKSAAPLMARGCPHSISDRHVNGSITSRLEAVITLPRAATAGVYELTRISYVTEGGQLGHPQEEEVLSDTQQLTFELIGEPTDTARVVDISFADS